LIPFVVVRAIRRGDPRSSRGAGRHSVRVATAYPFTYGPTGQVAAAV